VDAVQLGLHLGADFRADAGDGGQSAGEDLLDIGGLVGVEIEATGEGR
jgi:hypothetical protein